MFRHQLNFQRVTDPPRGKESHAGTVARSIAGRKSLKTLALAAEPLLTGALSESGPFDELQIRRPIALRLHVLELTFTYSRL